MKKSRTLKDRILLRISLKNVDVFFFFFFDDLGGYDQVGRALRQLAREGKLIKIGYGLYAKAVLSALTGKLLPRSPLPKLAREALSRLKVRTVDSTATQDYNSGRSTQVPTGRTIAVKGKNKKKIGYNEMFINYERKT